MPARLPDVNSSRRGRSFLKRFMYAQLSLLDAVKIALARTQPRVPFTVLAEPASMYFNFRVMPEALERFIRYINLPPGFEVGPVSCLQGEQPEFLLTLNVYEVSGIAKGVRAEWSTYIIDAGGAPRYMVLEARSSEYSMDPVDVITRRGLVEHSSRGATTTTRVASLDRRLFEARTTAAPGSAQARLHPAWVAANDFIYWRNGICDRTFYDSGLAFPRATLIESAHAQIDDQTHWAQFVEPRPRHIIRFEQAIEFVIMPWYNVAD